MSSALPLILAPSQNGSSRLVLPEGPTVVKARLPFRPSPGSPTSLADLVAELTFRESLELPDLLMPVARLRMTAEGLINLPTYGLMRTTDWSRAQLSKLLGVNWDRWFKTAEGPEMAEEINRRFARNMSLVSVRAMSLPPEEPQVPGHEVGVLRALLRPGYLPISDAAFARFLDTWLTGQGTKTRVLRYSLTDKSVTYVLALGAAKSSSDPKVGDIFPAICVRNSGVGFATFSVSAQVVRLVCSNGMMVPVDGRDEIFKLRHKGLDETRLRATLEKGFASIPKILADIPELLVKSREWVVDDIDLEITDVLQANHLPTRLLKSIKEAFGLEPEASVFGVVNAITRAAQLESPEVRHEFESAAGIYLQATANRRVSDATS